MPGSRSTLFKCRGCSALTALQALAPEVRFARGQEILQLVRSNTASPPSEMAFTAMGRMAAAAGRPHDAFAAVQELLSGPQTPRLRSFVPALKAYAAAGMVDDVFKVCQASKACAASVSG